MFVSTAEILSIHEIAELWGKQIGEPASAIERELLKAFQPKLGSRFLQITGEAVITRDDLLAFCEDRGIHPPKFWAKSATAVSSSGRAEAKCRKWLRDLREQGYTPETKPALRTKALAKFLGLSGRGFDRAWDAEAHDEWTKSGRPPKRSKTR